jgi:glycosyltransferase involved in cell wall biosynthesis
MPSCDIIIPVWNQETVTRKCLESISRHTPDSYGLIIIDNGSAEPARKYLDGLKAEYPARKIVLIRKEENVGFIRAVNEGIRASEAE